MLSPSVTLCQNAMTLEGEEETHVPAQPTPHSLPLLPLKCLQTGMFPPLFPFSLPTPSKDPGAIFWRQRGLN